MLHSNRSLTERTLHFKSFSDRKSHTSKWNVAAVRMQHCSTSLKQRFISQWNNTACRGTIVVVPYGICQSMIFTWNSRVLLRILCYYHCTGQKWQLSAQPPELKYPHFWAEIQIFRITDFEGTQIFFRTHFTRLPHQRRRNTYRASCNTSKLPKLKSLFNCDIRIQTFNKQPYSSINIFKHTLMLHCSKLTIRTLHLQTSSFRLHLHSSSCFSSPCLSHFWEHQLMLSSDPLLFY